MEFFDSHAHYNDERFEEDREAILNKLYDEEQITRITCVGYNIEKSKLAVKLAEEKDFLFATVGIHTRDASVDTIQILKEHPVKNTGIFHCCPLNQELIKNGLELGFYISFSGNITFKNAKSEEPVRLVPNEKILIETDSPYLTPEPFRGTRNDSSKVKLVAKRVSDIKGISLEEVSKITYQNANRVFKIKEK